jgi:hypothetical protein
MSLLLAIEPDSSQADRLRQLIRAKVDVELLVVTSAYAAIVAMNRQPPDVLLFGRSVAPRHQNTVLKHLRSLTEGDVPQVLTIPALSQSDVTPQKTSRFGFGWSRQPAIETPDPFRFADQVAAAVAIANQGRRLAAVSTSRFSPEPEPFEDAPEMDPGADSEDVNEQAVDEMEASEYDGESVEDSEQPVDVERPFADALTPFDGAPEPQRSTEQLRPARSTLSSTSSE